MPNQPVYPPPQTHYLTKPYPLLSFLFGLYCNKDWSSTEFYKWKAAGEDEHGKYFYQRYLEPYPGIPKEATEIISDEVPENENGNAEGRRRPTEEQAKELWPKLVAELSLPAQSNPADEKKKRAYFDAERPVLSALACIYLANADSVDQILGMSASNQDGSSPVPRELLAQIIQARGSSSSTLPGLLGQLEATLCAEFTQQPECW